MAPSATPSVGNASEAITAVVDVIREINILMAEKPSIPERSAWLGAVEKFLVDGDSLVKALGGHPSAENLAGRFAEFRASWEALRKDWVPPDDEYLVALLKANTPAIEERETGARTGSPVEVDAEGEENAEAETAETSETPKGARLSKRKRAEPKSAETVGSDEDEDEGPRRKKGTPAAKGPTIVITSDRPTKGPVSEKDTKKPTTKEDVVLKDGGIKSSNGKVYYPSKLPACEGCVKSSQTCRTTSAKGPQNKPLACLWCTKQKGRCSLVGEGTADTGKSKVAVKAKSESGGVRKRSTTESKGKGKEAEVETEVAGRAERVVERAGRPVEGVKELVGVFVPPLKARASVHPRSATPGPSGTVLVPSTPVAAPLATLEGEDHEDAPEGSPGPPPPQAGGPHVVDMRGAVDRRLMGDAEDDRISEGESWKARERRHADDRRANTEHAYEVAKEKLKWARNANRSANEKVAEALEELRETTAQVHVVQGEVTDALREMMEARYAYALLR
ncbi:hypothetical protein BD410DRAFT_846953 [Rickenella mellea]|uniref:Uncharacterized protein n=1 Tax=Rickenella mellea TaxID=50990 RepID=A0A4Y7PGG2_9AGAM|nr:hypothetical protein BD410DRAFT_846953 [Rickenella mellea]